MQSTQWDSLMFSGPVKKMWIWDDQKRLKQHSFFKWTRTLWALRRGLWAGIFGIFFSWGWARNSQENTDRTTTIVVLAPKVQAGPHQVFGTVIQFQSGPYCCGLKPSSKSLYPHCSSVPSCKNRDLASAGDSKQGKDISPIDAHAHTHLLAISVCQIRW